MWIADKYPDYIKEVVELTQVQIPLKSVMPSVTPVCFGTFYTGVQPEIHGIRKYEKPVIKTESFFDALISQGKSVAIVAETKSSMAMIFLEREMDYYHFKNIEEVNACAARLILEDKYDFIACYNGNYDTQMHRTGTESVEAIEELKKNAADFEMLLHAAEKAWAGKRCVAAFLPDHGCHDIDGNLGSHGLEMPEDMDIVHFYKLWK